VEWRLFTGDVPYVSTFEFHRNRDRAPHLEQEAHVPRLQLAAEFVGDAATRIVQSGGPAATVSDLGCGDGGLLSLVQTHPLIDDAWGYDFTPKNAAAWPERGVRGEEIDFVHDRDRVSLGNITVMTEVLEHLADPHGILRWVAGLSPWLVASSPAFENDVVHDGLHAWAWNVDGYTALVTQAGYEPVRVKLVTSFQVVLARSTRST
jgi:hypothetical protein